MLRTPARLISCIYVSRHHMLDLEVRRRNRPQSHLYFTDETLMTGDHTGCARQRIPFRMRGRKLLYYVSLRSLCMTPITLLQRGKKNRVSSLLAQILHFLVGQSGRGKAKTERARRSSHNTRDILRKKFNPSRGTAMRMSRNTKKPIARPRRGPLDTVGRRWPSQNIKTERAKEKSRLCKYVTAETQKFISHGPRDTAVFKFNLYRDHLQSQPNYRFHLQLKESA